MQKDANLVELEKCCRTHIFLQKLVLIQPRTSPPKICKIFEKCIFRKCIFENAFFENALFENAFFENAFFGNALGEVSSVVLSKMKAIAETYLGEKVPSEWLQNFPARSLPRNAEFDSGLLRLSLSGSADVLLQFVEILNDLFTTNDCCFTRP